MRYRIPISLVFAGLVAVAGCEADEEVFEEGATLEPPEQIEEAPIIDDVGPGGLQDDVVDIVPVDTLQEVPLEITDTAR